MIVIIICFLFFQTMMPSLDCNNMQTSLYLAIFCLLIPGPEVIKNFHSQLS